MSDIQGKRGIKASQVKSVIGAIFTKAGTNAKSLTPNAVIVASATDIATATDIITSVGHGFSTYEPVRVVTDNTLPTGIAANTTYYIIKVDDDNFKLATSLANAKAGTALNITAVGTGNQSIYKMGFFIADHGFINGERVQVAGAGLPSDVAAATDYWVILKNKDYFEIATSYANAIAGTALAWTNAGTDVAPTAAMTVTNTDELDGPDGMKWDKILATATGTFRVYFKEPFKDADFYVAIATPITADRSVRIKSKATTYVELEVKSIGAAPAAADGKFELIVFGSLANYLWS